MPQFASPHGFWYYIFSDMRKLDNRQRKVIAFLLLLGLLTTTLTFFSFDSPQTGHVRWTGFDILSSLVKGSPEMVLLQVPSWYEPGLFGYWNPLYLLGFISAYLALAISAFATAFQPFRRVLRLTGPWGACAAYWCLGRGHPGPFGALVPGILPGLGPLMLAIILLLTWLIAEVEVVPD